MSHMKIFTRLLLPISVLIMIFTGCSRYQGAGLPPAEATATLPATPTADLQVAPSVSPTVEEEPVVTAPVPTTDPAAHPLAGLVYRDAQGLWLVERDGTPVWLVDSRYAAVSPDGRLVAYAYGDPEDIYLMDRETGESRNLTNTPDRMERWPEFWEAQPNLLAFSSATLDEGMFGGGHPTLVNMDGSNYQVLDPQAGGEFSLSPDGDHIAFGCCDSTATMFSLSSGAAPFDPADYGTPVDGMLLPAFAPDNRQLAWAVNRDSTLGITLFDLPQAQSTFLHPYEPIGGSEYYGELAWSPDSKWLVYVNTNELSGMGRRPTLWALQPAFGDEIFLGEGYRPAWKPDGTRLAFTTAGETGTDWAIWISDPTTWANPEPAPFKGEIYGWVSP